MEKESLCVIVGGGIAGLSAADILEKNGISFKLLEARDRLGGRVHTIEHGEGVLELGAQWLHGACHANSVFNLAATNGLLGSDVRVQDDWHPGYFYASNGRIINEKIIEEAVALYEEILNIENCRWNLDHMNIKEYFWHMVNTKSSQLEDDWETSEVSSFKSCMKSFELAFSEYLCDDLEKSNCKLYAAGTELPGGDVIVPAGLDGLIKALSRNIGESIQLNTRVTNIDYSEKKVLVRCDDGTVISCGHVIVTIPLGVLKLNNQTLFTPKLDQDKLTVINSMGEGKICKIFLEWENPWWVPGHAGINFVWLDEEIENNDKECEWSKKIFNLVPVEGQNNILLFWVAGKAAEEVDQKEDEEIISTITWLIRKFTGDPTLQSPNRVIRNSWTKDPMTLGGYSYPSMKSGSDDYNILLSPVPSADDPRILLAGEHTHPEYWSFLHGARLSGVVQANKIVQMKS